VKEQRTPGTVALVGPGRAGTALALALMRRDLRVVAVAGRSADAPSTRAAAELLHAPAVDVAAAGPGADLVILATPDAAIAGAASAVAASLEPGALVVHLSGSRGVSELASIAATRPDVRLGALHPLQNLPSAERGVERLAGAWAAVSGPSEVTAIAELVGLRPFTVDDDARSAYHAAACTASNHLVALLAQVQHITDDAGIPFEAFLPLVRATVDNVDALGPAAALTGPVARGDLETVAAHLDALPDTERAAYRALAARALVLSGRDDPALRDLFAHSEVSA